MQFRVICDMNCKISQTNTVEIDDAKFCDGQNDQIVSRFVLCIDWKFNLFSNAKQLNLMFHYVTERHSSHLLQLKPTQCSPISCEFLRQLRPDT